MKKTKTRRIVSLLFISALLLPVIAVLGLTPAKVAAQPLDQVNRTIIIDMSHGQYEAGVFETDDARFAGNLTALGYEPVFAWGGLNASILASARGLMLGSINHEAASGVTPFTQAEIDAVGAWFNAGHKFIWVGADSDYGGTAWHTSNMTAMLAACGSHVYPEPSTISDPQSNAGSSYQVVANVTSSDPFVADLVAGVSRVLVHSPTLLYGSTSATPGADAVALETQTITDVYPVLYYSPAATIGDADAQPPYAHTDGTSGSFVAMTVEVNAGTDGTGVIVASGGSPYGSHAPFFKQSYASATGLTGYLLVKQTIDWGIETATYIPSTTTTTPPTTTTSPTTTGPEEPGPIDNLLLYAAIGIGVVVVLIVIVIGVRRR